MNTLTDVMNYFHFVMIAVYVLGGITVITTVANIKKKNCRTVFLVISTMVLFALISIYFFFGVLADNYAANLSFWQIHLNGIAFISVSCWIIQIVFLFLTKKEKLVFIGTSSVLAEFTSVRIFGTLYSTGTASSKP